MSVDLPAPFSPQSARTSPLPTVRLTLSNATTPGNRLAIPRISRRGAVVIRRVGEKLPLKHQARSTELQCSSKHQTPNLHAEVWGLELGISLELGCWSLELSSGLLAEQLFQPRLK